MTVVVTLDEGELYDAGAKALRRQCQNLTLGRKDAHGLKGAGWNEHLVGALGEAAVAKYFNVWWSGAIGRLKAADVGRLQVRTRTENWHQLILHKTDPDDDYYLLVHYDAPRFGLVGFMKGRDGKRDEFWQTKTGRPCYFIPNAKLHTDFSQLESVLYG